MQKVDFSSVASLFDANAVAIFNIEGRTKSYGIEGLSVGDTFKLVTKDGVLVEGAEFNENKYLRLNCEGDRANISVTSLLGTSKPRKYFKGDNELELAEGYTLEKALNDAWKPESRQEKEILPILAKVYLNKTFKCIASCEYYVTYTGNPEPQLTRSYLFVVEG